MFILYTGLFVIFAISHLQNVFARYWIRPDKLVFKENEMVWDIGICLLLNSPSDNESERGENKTARANISLFTVEHIKQSYNLQVGQARVLLPVLAVFPEDTYAGPVRILDVNLKNLPRYVGVKHKNIPLIFDPQFYKIPVQLLHMSSKSMELKIFQFTCLRNKFQYFYRRTLVWMVNI